MPRGPRCSICSNRKVRWIDKAIVEGLSDRRVAKQFGVGDASVRRHRKAGHVSKVIEKKAKAQIEAVRPDILNRLLASDKVVADALALAYGEDGSLTDPTLGLRAVREARENAIVYAKIRGEFVEPDEEGEWVVEFDMAAASPLEVP
jgi:transposase